MSFEAKYPGTCAECGAKFAVGIPIKRDGYGYSHEICPDSPVALKPGEVVCDRCWLVKPCECEEE